MKVIQDKYFIRYVLVIESFRMIQLYKLAARTQDTKLPICEVSELHPMMDLLRCNYRACFHDSALTQSY